MEGGDELANGAESFHPALWRPDGGGLKPTGTLEDRPYAPNPGAPVRPASVKSGKLASGWLAEYSCGESLLTQNRKHYHLHCTLPAGGSFTPPAKVCESSGKLGV